MSSFVLECCVDTLESAIAAQEGGATRLELCANLVIGGTTPSLFLFEEIRRHCTIPIHAIIRPRFGDFCYTESELRIMEKEVAQFRNNGAEGVVLGVLQPDGALNLPAMERLCKQAEGGNVTLHRAFDVARDPEEALKQAEELGIYAILTSGQRENALKGKAVLAKLAKQSKRVRLMAGAGVEASSICEIYEATGIGQYHLSGRVAVESPMVYRNPDVFMGLPSMSEYEQWTCSREKVSAARAVLEDLFGEG